LSFRTQRREASRFSMRDFSQKRLEMTTERKSWDYAADLPLM
jgi:hypothetical protein